MVLPSQYDTVRCWVCIHKGRVVMSVSVWRGEFGVEMRNDHHIERNALDRPEIPTLSGHKCERATVPTVLIPMYFAIAVKFEVF